MRRRSRVQRFASPTAPLRADQTILRTPRPGYVNSGYAMLGSRAILKYILPRTAYDFARQAYWNLLVEIGKASDVVHFLRNKATGVTFATRLGIIKQYYVTSANVDCPHTPVEILSI